MQSELNKISLKCVNKNEYPLKLKCRKCYLMHKKH